ncbi:hypothetical protein OIU79_008889 [Salix purpurea]|uniref:Uncharacterized protein n=1 Tax=Salix purpurea TaxID=77065 RepID=A0A9Q0TJF5_SALPP|nr:hypothetical protein OIU79_008889 [Salix purpurea]
MPLLIDFPPVLPVINNYVFFPINDLFTFYFCSYPNPLQYSQAQANLKVHEFIDYLNLFKFLFFFNFESAGRLLLDRKR